MTDGPRVLPSAGWFHDPHPQPQFRWWDGHAWTDYVVRPSDAPATVRVPVAQSASGYAYGQAPRRKWLGRWGGLIIVAGCIGIWLWMFATSLALHALNPHPSASSEHLTSLPAMLMLTGSCAVAAAFLYTMAYHLQPFDRLRPSFLVLAAVVGGSAATLLAGPANGLVSVLTGSASVRASPAALATAGLIEELLKIALVVVLAWRLPVKNARTGLFVGGAVGFGFSAFENMDYLQLANDLGHAHNVSLIQVIVTMLVREISGPFLHPLFTALLASALFAASRNGRFRVTLGVVGAYLGVAAAHSLYDSAGTITALITPNRVAAGALAFLICVLVMLATGLVWLRVVRRARASAYAAAAAGATSAA
jgi:RsiW-degrading membrane proteinase PrsW (M82 family)